MVHGFGRQRRGEVVDPVTPHVLAGQDRSPARTADGRGDKGVVEDHSIGGQLVEMGRLDDRVAHAAQVVEPLIVGQQEENIGPGLLAGRRRVRKTQYTDSGAKQDGQ